MGDTRVPKYRGIVARAEAQMWLRRLSVLVVLVIVALMLVVDVTGLVARGARACRTHGWRAHDPRRDARDRRTHARRGRDRARRRGAHDRGTHAGRAAAFRLLSLEYLGRVKSSRLPPSIPASLS